MSVSQFNVDIRHGIPTASTLLGDVVRSGAQTAGGIALAGWCVGMGLVAVAQAMVAAAHIRAGLRP